MTNARHCTPPATAAERRAQLWAEPAIAKDHHGRGAVWGLAGVFLMLVWMALFAGFYVMGGR